MYVMYILREHIVLIDCYYKRSKRQKLTMARNILYYIRPPTYPWTRQNCKGRGRGLLYLLYCGESIFFSMVMTESDLHPKV